MAYKSPKIKKAEYGLEEFFKKRAKYYIYGVSSGALLIADAILRSRNPYEAGLGYVIIGTSLLGYAVDYRTQIEYKKGGFKAKKVYTFSDGTQILADSEEKARQVYKLHQRHKENPHHFTLVHAGEKK